MVRNGLLEKINQDLAALLSAATDLADAGRRSRRRVRCERSPFGCPRLRRLSAGEGADQRRAVAGWSTRRTNGSPSGPASSERHIAADGELTSDLATRRRDGALRTPGLTVADIDLIVVATATPDNTFPGVGGHRPAEARHDPWRRLRPAGGLLGLRLCADHGRCADPGRPGAAGPGHRRRDLFAHPRLDRPRRPASCSATAPARWCSAARRSPAGAATAACSARICAPTAASRTSSMSTAARPRPARSAICAWRAARSSSTRSSMITDVIEDAFAATGFTAADIDWFVPHQANIRIIDATRQEARHPDRESHPHRRSPRQYLGGVDSAGAVRRRAATGGSSGAISFCWNRWAAASPGARCCCAGSTRTVADRLCKIS